MKIVNGKDRGRPGRWLVDFYDQHGKRRIETKATKEDALVRQAELEGQVSGGGRGEKTRALGWTS